jgi:spermidine synthase
MSISALLFIEGFIGLTYQIFLFRQLTPSVGSSSVTDGWIVGVFLGALSLGYFVGGKPTKEPLKKFGLNLVYTAIIGATAMSSFFIHTWFSTASPLMGRMPSLVFYCLIFVGPIAYYMGQSLPLLMQKSEWGDVASERGGNALFVSTLGSMVGAIIPISIIAPHIGATYTLAINTFVAAAIGFYLCFSFKKIITLLPLVLIAHTVLLAPYLFMKEGRFTSTEYSDIYFYESMEKKVKYLFANGLVMSSQGDDGKSASPYVEAFINQMDKLGVEESNVLILGSGGFMAHRSDKGNNTFTYVDIDSSLADWAEDHFGLEKNEIEIVVDDARAYLLSQADQKWDLIYLDTYSSPYSTPEHLMTVEFFNLVKNKLKPEGLLMFNAIHNTKFKTRFSKGIHGTVHKIFPYCHIIPVSRQQELSNIHYTCFNSDSNSLSYTDERNSISVDNWKRNSIL